MLCKRIENQKHFFRAPPSAKIVLIAKFLKILAKLWSQDWPNWLVGFGYNSGYMMHMGPIFWSLWDGAVSQHFFSTQRAYWAYSGTMRHFKAEWCEQYYGKFEILSSLAIVWHDFTNCNRFWLVQESQCLELRLKLMIPE